MFKKSPVDYRSKAIDLLGKVIMGTEPCSPRTVEEIESISMSLARLLPTQEMPSLKPIGLDSFRTGCDSRSSRPIRHECDDYPDINFCPQCGF